MVCPAEPNLRDSLPPPPDTDFSKEGTTAHWVAEQSITLGAEPHELVDKVCPDTGVTVTEEMADAVKVYVDEVSRHKGFSRTETRFNLAEVHPDIGGTSDYCVYVKEEKTLYVYDYKHGQGVFVEVDDNPQLKIYGLGAAAAIASLIGEPLEKLIEHIDFYVVQPRHRGGSEPIRHKRYELKDVIYWRDKVLKPAAEATDAQPPKFVAGEHCRFCPALGICQAARNHAAELAKVDFNRVVLPSPALLSQKDKARILQAEELISAWFSAVREQAFNDLQRGVAVPGFKLVAKRANRQWIDEAQVEAVLTKRLGQKAFIKKLLSPAQAEKELGKKEGSALVDQLTFKPDNGVTIAPEEDRRREATAGAVADFDDVVLAAPSTTQKTLKK